VAVFNLLFLAACASTFSVDACKLVLSQDQGDVDNLLFSRTQHCVLLYIKTGFITCETHLHPSLRKNTIPVVAPRSAPDETLLLRMIMRDAWSA